MKETTVVLEVAIPTYNRPNQLKDCLRALVNCAEYLGYEDRQKVGIRVHNNSTEALDEYNAVVSSFTGIFSRLNIGLFKYTITGVNIGAPQNNYSVIMSSESEFTWYMPDDDLPRLDSLVVLMSVIDEFKPNLIIGGAESPLAVDYSISDNRDQRVPHHAEENSISCVVEGERCYEFFFGTNIIAAQNLVYNSRLLRAYVAANSMRGLVDPFLPAFLALICLNRNGPMVLLRLGIGIFRYNEPCSEWRHEWNRYALEVWPRTYRTWRKLGLVRPTPSHHSYFISSLYFYQCRLWCLFFGKYRLNLLTVARFYPFELFLMLFQAPFVCLQKVVKRSQRYLKLP